MKAYLSSMCIVICSIGCGPIYDTVYTLTPPASPAGLACVESCEDQQNECERYLERRGDEWEEGPQGRGGD